MKNKLHELSAALIPVHKKLMNHQKEAQERADEKRMSVNELLQHCIQHPEFIWLKKLSSLIAEIDENADGTDEEIEIFKKESLNRLVHLFIDEEKEINFKEKMKMALELDPTFHLDLTLVKKHINHLRRDS